MNSTNSNASQITDQIPYGPFIMPDTLTAPSSDPEWLMRSDWMFHPYTNSPLPALPFVFPSAPAIENPSQASYFSPFPGYYRSPGYFVPPNSSHYRVPQEESGHAPSATGTTTERIRRPPNAFMLYRSNLLSGDMIPGDVECRQQNLSRVAGECWNMASEEEKKHWREKAAEALADHRKKYPNYKFMPAPRGSRKPKPKPSRTPEEEAAERVRIRKLREDYVKVNGPARSPARRRRVRVTTSIKKEVDDSLYAAALTPLPPSIPPSPASTASDGAVFVSPLVPPVVAWSQNPADVSRPCTPSDLQTMDNGFAQVAQNLSRPSSAASSDTGLSNMIRDLDITPTAANFRSIPAPVQGAEMPETQLPTPPYVADTPLCLRGLSLPYFSTNQAQSGSNPFAASTSSEVQSLQTNDEDDNSFLRSLYADMPPSFYDNFGAFLHPVEGEPQPTDAFLMDGWGPLSEFMKPLEAKNSK